MTEKFYTTTINGKTIRIPEEEIAKNMANLSISRDEAIELCLCDRDYMENDEVETLTKKAKSNGITTAKMVKARSTTPQKKTQKERVTKPDPTKELIILTIAASLAEIATDVEVVDSRKIITFDIGEDTFKVDLSRTRKPKSGA